MRLRTESQPKIGHRTVISQSCLRDRSWERDRIHDPAGLWIASTRVIEAVSATGPDFVYATDPDPVKKTETILYSIDIQDHSSYTLTVKKQYLINQIVQDHWEVMRRFGYLDENGKIVYG